MTVEESYSHIVTTMFGTVAKLVLVADVVFIFSYSAIVWKMILNKPIAVQRRHKQQRRLTNTVNLCLGIALVFFVFTTPFVVVYLTTWNRPAFLKELSMYLFLMNPVSNSLVYLIKKYRSRRAINVQKNNTQQIDVDDSKL